MKEQTSVQKKMDKAEKCAVLGDYVSFEKISNNGKPGHYIFKFTRRDGKEEEKELCIVDSKYKLLWEGDCDIYLPTLQFASPKGEVYMLTPNPKGDTSHQIVYIAPRWSLANIFQTKGAASLVLNYYAKPDKTGFPSFMITDEDNMPLGRKVRAEVRIQEKKNEKGRQTIVDCFVYLATEPARDPEKVKFMTVQKIAPTGFKTVKTFNIEGEDRKVFICEK